MATSEERKQIRAVALALLHEGGRLTLAGLAKQVVKAGVLGPKKGRRLEHECREALTERDGSGLPYAIPLPRRK